MRRIFNDNMSRESQGWKSIQTILGTRNEIIDDQFRALPSTSLRILKGQ